MNENFIVININELINEDSQTGEDLEKIISSFSCPKNNELEFFFKNNCVEFAKRGVSVSYFVVSSKDDEMLGYFTLTIKPLTVPNSNNFNRKTREAIERFGMNNEDSYTLPAYLIAQLGKNYTNQNNTKIKGEQLMRLALNKIKEIQNSIGGRVVFLEYADNEKLQKFYQENGFTEFGDRTTKEGQTLIQALRIVRP